MFDIQVIKKHKISDVLAYSAAAAKSLQSCPTLCDSRDGSPPGSPIPGILQARTLEWGAISFSNAWKWKVKVKSLSHARLLVTPWTAAYQAPPSMRFSRQEYWSGVPLPSPAYSSYIYIPTFHCRSLISFVSRKEYLFWTVFHYDLLQNVEYCSVIYNRTCCLSILYIVVYFC